MEWNEERIAELRRLWSEGFSASQIADRLGGITRNAVIGKAHRLNLPGRPSPIQRQLGERKARQRPAAARPAAERMVLAAVAEPRAAHSSGKIARAPRPFRGGPIDYSAALTLTDRNCHWPIGHPNEPGFHFCGAPSSPGRPYCTAHCQQAYRKVDDAAA